MNIMFICFIRLVPIKSLIGSLYVAVKWQWQEQSSVFDSK